jgi:hypothetical protein
MKKRCLLMGHFHKQMRREQVKKMAAEINEPVFSLKLKPMKKQLKKD